MNRLLESEPDTFTLCVEVERRFLDLCESYMRIRGVELQIPEDLKRDMYRWREMAVRFKQGDYRNTEAEKESLKMVAQWTVNVNAQLRGQEPGQVEWKD